MAAEATEPGAERRINKPPSLVELAARTLRRMIIGGELLPGDRVVENRLTAQFGISRPPLREAMRLLEHEGLIRQERHRAAIVTPLTLDDAYEIVTLRRTLERMAVDLAVPVRETWRLRRCRDALDAMAASTSDAELIEHSFEFHLAIVGLAGHRRLEEAYRSLQLQLLLCMTLNRRARHERESRQDNVRRHRELLALIERGDAAAVHDALERHGDRTFVSVLAAGAGPAGERAREWAKQLSHKERT